MPMGKEMKKKISLIVLGLLFCSCSSVPVGEGPSVDSVRRAIEQYERIGAPGGKELHETNLEYQIRGKKSAVEAFKQMVEFDEALSDLEGRTADFEIYLIDMEYYYSVVVGSKHVYLLAAKKGSTSAFWIAMI